MSVGEQGFSLLEVLIAMAISSVLLMGACRFLPALQMAIARQTQRQALEEELWQRLQAVSGQLQRAGYCRGTCQGEALHLETQCVLIRWDANANGMWEETPASMAEVTGFRLQNGVLETLRGALSCSGKGWEKMTDPQTITVDAFSVERHNVSGYPPVLSVMLAARPAARGDMRAEARYHVTGHNL
ncbi:prepilin peptidase-dependent protein [Pluralibacter sp.]|uniref:prepilin peptidase-dependent protein n=1 Tax=Pluralibacter sp. TaxID=1920032 RepID=UPI0025F8F20B|nr:prepilin peptidase-dependent protein [Pluralibacter sp.]MBV8041206.1 prepilin peptidase-dependent protein [Pluralibacter sp.]